MHPLFKFLIGFFLVVLLAVVVMSFAAGPMVKRYINDNGPSLVGRPMHTDDVSINVFTGSLQIDSLVIAEPDGQTPFVSIHALRARLSIPRLMMGVYALDNLDVDRLRMNLEQRDTVLNCSDVLHFLLDGDDSEPLPLVLSNINIHHSSIRYQDLSVRSDFRINDFSLFIPGLDLRDISTSVGVSLSLGDGGQLSTKVDYDDRQQTYKVDLTLDDFNLQSILPYVRQQIAFGEVAGTLNLNLSLQGSLEHLLQFSLHGNAGVRGLNILDPDGHPMVQCDTVDIGIRDIDLPKNRIEFSRLVLDRPSFRLSYGKDSLDNFSRLLVASSSSDNAVSDDASVSTVADDASGASVTFNGQQQPLCFIIDRLAIQDASLSYRDESLQAEPFDYHLSHVNFTAPNLTLDRPCHLTANARLGEEGTFHFSYDGMITDQRNMKLSVQADHIQFRDFSPYTVQMFGNEVTAGELSLHMIAQTLNGELLGQNHFLLRDPKVEKKRHDVNPEMNIPFRAGMYLLTDRDNVCDLDIPVQGNILEPRFSYKRLIFRTLGKLIVKVATSPFRRSASSGTAPSASELLRLDDRPLDSIPLDSLSSDLLQDE